MDGKEPRPQVEASGGDVVSPAGGFAMERGEEANGCVAIPDERLELALEFFRGYWRKRFNESNVEVASKLDAAAGVRPICPEIVQCSGDGSRRRSKCRDHGHAELVDVSGVEAHVTGFNDAGNQPRGDAISRGNANLLPRRGDARNRRRSVCD